MKDNTKGIIAVIIIAFLTFGFLFWLYAEMKPFRKPMIDEVIFEKETSFTAMLGDDIKALVVITMTDPIIDVNDILRMMSSIRDLLYTYTSDQIVRDSRPIIAGLAPIKDRSPMKGLTFLIKFLPKNGEMFILEL